MYIGLCWQFFARNEILYTTFQIVHWDGIYFILQFKNSITFSFHAFTSIYLFAYSCLSLYFKTILILVYSIKEEFSQSDFWLTQQWGKDTVYHGIVTQWRSGGTSHTTTFIWGHSIARYVRSLPQLTPLTHSVAPCFTLLISLCNNHFALLYSICSLTLLTLLWDGWNSWICVHADKGISGNDHVCCRYWKHALRQVMVLNPSFVASRLANLPQSRGEEPLMMQHTSCWGPSKRNNGVAANHQPDEFFAALTKTKTTFLFFCNALILWCGVFYWPSYSSLYFHCTNPK